MFFSHLAEVGAIKSEYRTLAKLHHPDLGGDTATMQKVNAEYHAALENLNGQVSMGFDKKEHTYHYSQEVEQEVMDKISELLAMALPNTEIELIGTWIWVSGDTRPVKDKLKEVGCRWHGKRKVWYWRRFTHRRRYSNMSMNQIRRSYGSQTFDSKATDALQIAA